MGKKISPNWLMEYARLIETRYRRWKSKRYVESLLEKEKIYSSHVLDHFSCSDLIKLLVECLRVLALRGTFSLCIPDVALDLDERKHESIYAIAEK